MPDDRLILDQVSKNAAAVFEFPQWVENGHLASAHVAMAIVASLTGLGQEVEAIWTNVDQAMPGDGGIGFNAA